MKKIGDVIGNIVSILFVLICISGVIDGLINDTKETLQSLAIMATIGGSILAAITIHKKQHSKNKIDWVKYRELDTICGWLGVASWLFLASTVGDIIMPRVTIISTGAPIYSVAFVSFIISIFSFWIYFSLLLGKRNALSLVRAYLISMASLLIMILTIFCKRGLPEINMATQFYSLNLSDLSIEKTFYLILSIIIISAIIALCIKGLIISFRHHIVELFKDSKISYWQILVMVLLWASIITLHNTQITFTKETHSDYPALNVSK